MAFPVSAYQKAPRINQPAARTTWERRRWLAWALRVCIVLTPLVAAVAAMVAVSRLVHRPKHGLGEVVWFGGLLLVSWVVSWAVGRLLHRLLPLAALLDLSLTFPERAPSRLRITQRVASGPELARMAAAPPDESTQAAAERILGLLASLASHD